MNPKRSAAGGLLAGLVCACLGCPRPPEPPPPDPTAEAAAGPTAGVPWFTDVAGAAGLTFVHFDSSTDKYYIPETVGSGLGWVDYDGDGWLDLFCVQDCPIR